MTSQPIDRSKLTFSQAEGIDPLPQPSVLGKLTENARNFLWDAVLQNLLESTSVVPTRFGKTRILENPWLTILRRHHVEYLIRPADEFDHDPLSHLSEIKKLLFDGEYNRVFDFLQFVLRCKYLVWNFRDRNFHENIARILESHTAYAVIDDGPSIIPIVMPEQRESIEEAFRLLRAGPFEAARDHLRKSAENIRSGDFRGSIRESIHAVESVACRLNEDARTSLKPALDALSKKIPMHPAFKDGIEKLYGYTNDENGIRHAATEKDTDVDMHDAVFMFGACASFAAYLFNKAREAGLLNST